MLAHKAEEEGIAVAEILKGEKPHIDYNLVPNVIYTWPEVSSVGRTEQQLIDDNVDYKVGKFPMRALGRSRASSDLDGFVKIIADKKSDEILGVHIIGARAADLIVEGVTAMEFRASCEDISIMSHPHPTYSEAMKEAALSALDNTLSPVVDLDRMAVIFTSNRLNQPITDYTTDNRINTLQEDPNAFVYASKPITLESGASGIKIHLEGHINLTSDLRAFYAISENPNDELVYQAFPGYDNLLSTGQIIDPAKNSGLPDKALPKTDVIAYTPDQVVWNDYEFTIDNLATFRYFSIKFRDLANQYCIFLYIVPFHYVLENVLLV